MPRILRIKRLVILLAVLAPTIVAVHFLHAFQVTRNARQFLRIALKAKEENDLHKAAEYQFRYLQLVPQDFDALSDYGLLLEELADKSRNPKLRLDAYFTLEKVLRHDPSRSDVRRQLVRIAMHPSLERFKDAREHLQILLGAAKNDAELEFLLGRCFEGSLDYVQARNWYALALDHDSHHVQAHERCADVLRRPNGGQIPESSQLTKELWHCDADGVMAHLEKYNSGSPSAYVALSRYKRTYDREHGLDGAEKYLQMAREWAPDDAEVLLESAALAAQRADWEKAIGYLNHGLQVCPMDQRIYQEKSRIELKAGRPKDALQTLKDGFERLPNDVDLHWELVELLLAQGKVDEAGEHIQWLRNDGLLGLPLRYLQARVDMAHAEWLLASKGFERILPDLVRSPHWQPVALASIASLGQCYEHLGKQDAALQVYKQALELDPSSEFARLATAAILAQLGKLQDAEETYLRLLAEMREPARRQEMRLAIARLQIVRTMRASANQTDEARQAAWDEVDRLLQQAASDDPSRANSVELLLLHAEVLTARGKTDAADTLLANAIVAHPEDIAIRLARASLDARLGKLEAAWQDLDDAEKLRGNQVEVRITRARLIHLCGGPEEWKQPKGSGQTSDLERDAARAHAIVRLVENIDDLDYSPADQELLLRNLVQILYALGDHKDVTHFAKELVRRQPSDLSVQLLLFDVARETGDDEGIRQTLSDIKAIETHKGEFEQEGTVWRYCEVCILMQRALKKDADAIARARVLLEQLAKARPYWGRVPALFGELHEIDGNPQLAVVDYKKAFDLGERHPLTITRLLKLLRDRGEIREAAKVIASLPQDSAISGSVQRLVAEISMRNGQYERALEIAKRVISTEKTKDYRDQLLLAQIAVQTHKEDEAKAAFEKASELAPDKGEVWLESISFLVETGKKDNKERARKMLDLAEKRLDPDRDILALAACYEALDLQDKAEAAYRIALRKHADNPDPALLWEAAKYCVRRGKLDEADAHLQQIIDLSPSQELGAWARILRLNLSTAKDPKSALQALQALQDQPLPASATRQMRLEAARARALALARLQDSAHRREAIKLLDEFHQDGMLAAEDEYLLASLYESLQDWKHAKSLLEPLLAPGKVSAALLFDMGAMFLRHGENEHVQLCLTAMEEADKKQGKPSLSTAIIRAGLAKLEGRTAEGVKLLNQWAEPTDADLARIAAAIEQIDGPSADPIYRQIVRQSKKPEAPLTLALYLGRQRKIPEALALCEPCWTTCRAVAVASASVGIIYLSGPPGGFPEQTEKVADRIKAALEKEPTSAELHLWLAHLRNFQGQYDEAVRLYKEIVAGSKSTPDHDALNNLAWLLALKGNADESIALVSRAIELSGPQASLLDTRAMAELRLKQPRIDLALRDLKDAAELQPSATIYFHTARALLAADRREDAKKALKKAREMGFKAESVHPLERAGVQSLLDELN